MRINQEILDKAISIRHYLHENPEVSSAEYNTSTFISSKLNEYPPDKLVSFDNLGFLAIYGEQPGNATMIRGDFDALPIQELNEFTYTSKNEGVSHMCGHDGHTAILMSMAMYLSVNKPEKGSIGLLFQPAEENGEGAQGIMNDSKFCYKPDYVVALHNIPGYPKNSIIIKDDSFTPAVTSIILKLKGKTAHAAQPETGINPAMAMSQIINQYLITANTNLEDDDYRIITPIYAKMGSLDHGISADDAEMHFTIRAWNNELLAAYKNELTILAGNIAEKEKLKLDISYTQSFYANVNNRFVNDCIRKSAKSLSLNIIERTSPFTWGEDFGVITNKYKGAMFGIGAGEKTSALHNPDYDFPDEIISPAAEMFLELHHILHQ